MSNSLPLPDPLEASLRPDRVHYDTGVLLDAEDFVDEQTYHRTRLARALAYLHGSGTVVGLGVSPPQRLGSGPAPDWEVHVQPGLALDRYGRLIEVPERPWCLRINRWWNALADAANAEGRSALAAAFRGGAATVDVFLLHQACPRGITPSFAEGAMDATDATVPHRVRDGFRIVLAPRDVDPTDAATLPGPRFAAPVGADPASRLQALKQLLLGGFDGSLARPGERALPALGEPALSYRRETPLVLPPAAAGLAAERLSPAAVFLARLRIPATDNGPGNPPTPDFFAMGAAQVDNLSRSFVYPTDALALALG
jgi:hypothetical protein